VQIHAPQQVGEAWARAQGSKSGITLTKASSRERSVRFFQPLERLVLLAKSCIDSGDVDRWNIPCLDNSIS
jgi:hypothetical protein